MADPTDGKTPLNEPGKQTHPTEPKDKWAAALDTLSAEERERFTSVKDALERDPRNVLVDVLAAANEKKDECMRRRWKLVIKGRTIILRDVLEKISVWVSKITVDIRGYRHPIYDPGNAALPWAAIRLILQTGVNDVEVFGYVLNFIEGIANAIAAGTIFELRYLRRYESRLDIFTHLSSAVRTLYGEILRYLSEADFEEKFKPVETARKGVWELGQLAEAEKSDWVLAEINGLQDGQKSQAERERQQFEALGRMLSEIQAPIDRIGTQLKEIQDGLERETRVKILRAISDIQYSSHHKSARKGRLQGSGQWLLQKPEYRWRDDSASAVLWLHGIPGSGKTKLASLIIDDLQTHESLAFVYCMRNPAEPERGRCDRILASLVRQLAASLPNGSTLPPVLAHYRNALSGTCDFENQTWTNEESSAVLLELMEEYPAVTIVLDALDEVSQEDRQELMDILSELLRDSPNLLKIFISSRSNIDIALHFEGSPNVYIDSENSGDISAFIDDRLKTARLLRGQLSTDLHTKIQDKLHDGARGMFRWVDLQIQALRHLKVAADIESRLGALPVTLEESYWEIYQEILNSGEHGANLAIFTFRWLLYAKASISMEAFAHIACYHLQSGSGPGFTVTEITDVCANLIIARSGSFEFAHLSVREFLEGLRRRNLQTFLSDFCQESIAVACLQLLHAIPDDDPEFDEPENPDKVFLVLKRFNATPRTEAVDYATQFWVKHVRDCFNKRVENPLSDLIKSFLLDPLTSEVSPKFKRWCEKLWRIDRLRDSTKAPHNPIWLACLHDWFEIVEFLYQNTNSSLDLEQPRHITTVRMSHGEVTPLFYGVFIEDFGLVQCISRCDSHPSLQGSSGRTKNDGSPLLHAASKGAVDYVTILLRRGPSLETQGEALYRAVAHGHFDVVKLLIDHKPEVISRSGYSATFKACADGKTDIVRYLFDKGAPTERGVNFVFSAVLNRHIEITRFLLKRDIAMRSGDVLSKTLIVSVSHGDEATTALLLQHGAYKEPVAVIRATRQDIELAMIYFVNSEYDVHNCCLEISRTVLFYAAEKGFDRVMDEIMEKAGFQSHLLVNVYDGKRRTPLHISVAAGHAACVQILLKHEAKVFAEDGDGRTPLGLARMRGREACESLILGSLREEFWWEDSEEESTMVLLPAASSGDQTEMEKPCGTTSVIEKEQKQEQDRMVSQT
ncbi:ankyrin repeat protein [Rhypophila decipiens]|uniref:Ankyrin repeat protein n=1 Tax=Rhypophila decipiens TaxID=261697 RepID=A0AAN7B7T7_9PEZI|nr:ankyrin repeat protein [Rhypophila decipiens]